MARSYFVYIMANPWSRVLYTGVTNDLELRVRQHKSGETPGFTQRYRVTALVYYEEHAAPLEAIEREKQIKRWNRGKKLRLIEMLNPEWEDLAESWFPDGASVGEDGQAGQIPRLRSG